MTSFVRRILEGGELTAEIAEALLMVVPKVKNPCLISQFCPISLCNVTFMLITKSIVNRLKNV